uniref:Uncharacterized protein n=1 Tax=Arundo donax TaxID=35708 RepID=A0A0A9G3I1_ARUDO
MILMGLYTHIKKKLAPRKAFVCGALACPTRGVLLHS